MRPDPTGPLAGIRVIEIGRYIAAPYAGRQLADLGAEVVKVEDPDGGDPMRRWEGGSRPYSPQFAAYNRGKRSITLDLKSAEGRTAFLGLVADADVLLENFRPGVMDRLGIGASRMLELNPSLVYCSITGFGSVGSHASRPSYDTVISAMGGLYSLLLPPDRPSPVGPAMSDLLSGLFAVQGILAALLHRSATGQGQVVDVTMLGSVLGFLTEAVTNTTETGEQLQPNTRQRRAQAYGAVASDGKAFIVHLSVPDKFWHALTEAMEHPQWRLDPRFATRQARFTHYAELDGLIKAVALTRTRDEWLQRFVAHDIPTGALNTVLDVVEDPQVATMALLEDVPVEGGPPMRMVRPPVSFSRTPPAPGRAAPRLGEHTASVLDEVGGRPLDRQDLGPSSMDEELTA